MMNAVFEYAPVVGLLFFFLVFVGIAVWALRPSAKHRLQNLAYIPLKEDNHE